MRNVTKWAGSLLFLESDLLESELNFALESAKRDGIKMEHRIKYFVNRATKALAALRSEMQHIDTEEQIAIGDDSDVFRQFIWMLLDRAGRDRGLMEEMYAELKKRPSELGIDLKRGEVVAFGKVIE